MSSLPQFVSSIFLFGFLLFSTWPISQPTQACTTAVISGKVTPDGRPLLWKNRDNNSAPHNEVAILTAGQYRAVAVVNAGSRKSIWMGVNAAGFCIENSLSKDLGKANASGPSNGPFMKLALESCATVADFQQLLEKTNLSGRRTVANFGVIDAHGGAALFETGPDSFQMFDANDPQVAPHGFIVRANFSTTAQNLPANPTADQLANVYSAERFLRARKLLSPPQTEGIQLEYLLRHVARDLADPLGVPISGSVNDLASALPASIPTEHTISRTSTVSGAVFHGVKPGEDPALTTMWTILGDPKFSIAVPCWATAEEIADPLEDPRGGELGEIARLLRDWSLTKQRDAVLTIGLPGIWSDLWELEQTMIERVAEARRHWGAKTPTASQITQLHHEISRQAMAAMQQELREAKELAVRGPDVTPASPAPIRIAIYDHSGGSANGPKNLQRLLTPELGFATAVLTPQAIQNHSLDQFDVLIMPGGSGSSQAKHLEANGSLAVQKFVKNGGGYLGICAGAYLASSHYDWSLNLINSRVWDRAHWARGTGTVQLEISELGGQLFNHQDRLLDVHYAQGPLLIPGNHPQLPRYEVLASYHSEVAKKGAPEEAMLGTHAIVRAPHGKGRVICFSPHPEAPHGPGHLIITGARWAAGEQIKRSPITIARQAEAQLSQ